MPEVKVQEERTEALLPRKGSLAHAATTCNRCGKPVLWGHDQEGRNALFNCSRPHILHSVKVGTCVGERDGAFCEECGWRLRPGQRLELMDGALVCQRCIRLRTRGPRRF